DHAQETLLGVARLRDRLFQPAQAFGEALLHHGEQNVLLGLEVIERAARMHAGRARDVADRGAVESFLAEQFCRDAQQFVAPVGLVVAAGAGLALRDTHDRASRGSDAGASISMRSSAAATFLPRLSKRSDRAAPPCSAALSTIF